MSSNMHICMYVRTLKHMSVKIFTYAHTHIGTYGTEHFAAVGTGSRRNRQPKTNCIRFYKRFF